MNDIVRVKLEDGSEASVGASFAESYGLTVLDKPAVDKRGRGLPAKPHVDITLRGAELNEQLTAFGLSTGGSLADRQSRLADHQSALAGDDTAVTGDQDGGESL
jgi:hypothetical protein